MNLALSIPVWLLAAEGETGYQAIISALQSAISAATISPILVAGLTASLVFVVFWFGVRKVLRIFMSGFRKGKATA